MNGLVYVCFGPHYDKMGAHCIAYSRRYTDIPITVLTNLSEEDRNPKWKIVPNINFEVIVESQDFNRKVKTSINKFSPYDKTLYLDCDAIIQTKGIEKVFNFINDSSITLNIYSRWHRSKALGGIYKKTFEKCGISLPINIYYGALVGFGRSDKINDFFKIWQNCWTASGSGRDMPALAAAVVQTKINVIELSNKNQIFTWKVRSNFIIQHEYGKHLRRLVGCPDFRQYKPFDRRTK